MLLDDYDDDDIYSQDKNIFIHNYMPDINDREAPFENTF